MNQKLENQEIRADNSDNISTESSGTMNQANTSRHTGADNAHANQMESNRQGINCPHIISGPELMSLELPPPVCIVPGLISQGLTLLAGKPKIGKSWFCLNLAHALANGGQFLGEIAVNPQKVLYIALEDNPRRMQSRLRKMLGDQPVSPQIHLAFRWPRIDQDDLGTLEDWLSDNPETQLVIIDTLVRIRGGNKNSGTYDKDYNMIFKLKTLADNRQIAIVVVHHLRKTRSEDIFDMVSGTNGLTAAADSVALLLGERWEKDAVLQLSSRDLEDKELELHFDSETQSWVMLGQADEYRLTPERQEVVNFLREQGGPVKLDVIARALNKERTNISNLLKVLVEQGLVERPKYGFYQIRNGTSETSGTVEDSETNVGIESSAASENSEISESADHSPSVLSQVSGKLVKLVKMFT